MNRVRDCDCRYWKKYLSILGGTLLLMIAGVAVAGQSSFVNDREPYSLFATDGSKFRDIIISDSGIVTLFWEVGIPRGRASLARLYTQRFWPNGQPQTDAVPIFADSLASIVSWIHVGSSATGEWTLVNHLVVEDADEQFSDRGLYVFKPRDVRKPLDSGQMVGNRIQPQDYSHWGCSGVDSAGDYVVCWGNNREPEGAEVWCQLFDADGEAKTDTIRVSSARFGDREVRDQRNVKVAMSPGGRFVVLWQAICDSCATYVWIPQIFMRLYENDGSPTTDVICASCDSAGVDRWTTGCMYPDVGMQANNDFAVVWRQQRNGCRTNIMLRRYFANGEPIELPIVVDSNQCHVDATPYVASDSAGNLVVAWQDDDGDPQWLSDLKARRYDPAGRPVGEEFKINDGDKNVLLVTTPVALNNNGLVGFLWSELWQTPDSGSLRQRDMMQLMDLQDIGVYLCGDANNDRVVDRKDIFFLLTYVLGSGQSPASADHVDMNCDGFVDLADIVRLAVCMASPDCSQTLCPQ
jgi:hypothetical protein